MKTFKKTAAQGDVFFERIGDLVDRDKLVTAKHQRVEGVDGQLILAHSETGHHHTMDAADAGLYREPDQRFDSVLVVNRETTLDHQREEHTHESIAFEPGIYRVTRQRESSLSQRIRYASD